MTDRKGFTLLELILAMTMLSVILLASATLDMAGARLTSSVSESTHLENDVNFTLRALETDLQDAVAIEKSSSIFTTSTPIPNSISGSIYTLVIKQLEANGTSIFTITYEINFQTAGIKRTCTPGSNLGGATSFCGSTSATTTTMIPSGQLSPKIADQVFNTIQPPVSFSVDNKLMTVSLAAHSVLSDGRTVEAEGATRSFLIRGIPVSQS